MASLRCRRDPCGVICLILTYFSVFYADYVVIHYVLLPAYSNSVWCTLHGSAFNLILMLLLACHSRAVFSDPGQGWILSSQKDTTKDTTLHLNLCAGLGVVPLPDTAIDFSDLRSQSSRMNERGCEGWTVCSRCETYRPPRAHHCRVCQRCIRRMDHHCPWINNCVGELNQKYFIQFLFYTGMASLYSLVLVVSSWVWRIRNERESDTEKEGEETPSKHLIVAHYIILLVESVLFGVFVMVIFYDQLVSIITDETPIEQMKNRLMIKDRSTSPSSSSSSTFSQLPHQPPHSRKPKLALLREVFGRGSIFCWLLPLQPSPPSVGGVTYSALPDYNV
ncbi:zf-DHHC domain-containing protein isoform X1 [Takifugu flavidus]|uniref:zf-DHHC domain-containing protein isoform X1 n=1 Tax=Takifugu flavidus TaxID=433684 RepID=UPI0025443861|nr:zf-DHHC domain-containing protein isoform X1 [Takifugu flavidus]